jgi:hypothetical protein
MKKILIIAALLITAHFTKAQTEKGNQTLGLNLHFQHLSSSGTSVDPVSNTVSIQDQNNTSFYAGPIYSYFISNNVDMGGSLQFSSNHIAYNYSYGEQKQVNNNFGGTVFLRKYFMYQNKVGLRAGPYATYSHGNTKSNNPASSSVYDLKTKDDSYGAGLNAELLYYPSNHLGVSLTLANLNYNHFKSDSGSRGSNSGDSVNATFINSGLGISVFYTFGTK